MGLIFLFPAAAVLAALMLYPLCYMLYMSTFEWFVGGRVPPRFVALGNYAALLQDPRFGYALLRTLFYTAIALGVEVTIGTGMALLLSRSFLGRGLTRTLLLLPMVATPVAISLVWLLMFDPVLGVLNYLLSYLAFLPSVWANSPGSPLVPALVDVWQWTPLVMLIVLAGLTALPPEPFEAAVLDGASASRRFIHITLPLLRPYLIVAAFFADRRYQGVRHHLRHHQGRTGRSSETLNLYIYATPSTTFTSATLQPCWSSSSGSCSV